MAHINILLHASAAVDETCATTRITQRVQVPNNWVLGVWVMGIMVSVLGKYTILRYLDP